MATIEELDAQTRASIDAQNKGTQVNLTGGSTIEDQRQLEAVAEDTPMTDLISKGFDSFNAAVGLSHMLDQRMIPSDPNFSLETSWEEITKDVPGEYRSEFLYVDSKEEASFIKNRIQSELQSKALLNAAGYKGTVATVLASALDVDAVLMLASGGSLIAPKVGSTLAKMGVKSSIVTTGLKTAAAGAEAGLITETANVIARPTADAQDILSATVGGLVFGSIVGGVAGTAGARALATDETGSMMVPLGRKSPEDLANEAVHKMNQELAASKLDGSAGNRDYTAAYGNAKDFELTDTLDQVGADKTILEASTKYIKDRKINERVKFGDKGLQKAAKKFHEIHSASPLASDYDRLFNSGSDVLTTMADKMLESASGIVRNNRSAANMKEIYHTQIATPFMNAVSPATAAWAISKGKGKLDSQFPTVQAEFGREFMLAHNHKYLNGVMPDGTHASISHLSQAMDASNYKAIELGNGRPGEIGVRGFEEIEQKPGWMRQQWHSEQVVKVVKELDAQLGGKDFSKGKKALADVLSSQYQNIQGWTKEAADIWANAVVRRAISNERGTDTNVYRMIDEEGIDYAVDFITDSGVSRVKAEEIINSLLNRGQDKKNPGYLKKRGELDLSTQIPGTNLQLVDLMNPDITSSFMSYSSQVAGHSALARHGIQYADRKTYLRAANNELIAKGKEPLNPEVWNGIFDAFNGGAILGGVDPWVRRVNQTTRLAVLNGQGITQLAETGAIIASVGISNFGKVSGGVISDILKGKHVEGLGGMADMLAPINGVHVLHRPHITLEEGMKNSAFAARLGLFLDKSLGMGVRLQNVVTGFNKVMQIEQNIAINGMMHKLYGHFTGGKLIDDPRLYDIGFGDAAVYNRMAKYFQGDNPAIYKNASGELTMDWKRIDPFDKEDFALALNRHTNQVVQKEMLGEGTYWFNKTQGAALLALKRFTLLSLQKQVMRNARMADSEALAVITYSTMTAGLAYATRETLAGRGDDLDSEKIARGAIGYGNITGALAFGYDPLMMMLGQDDMKLNQYDRGGLFSTPVQLETMNRLFKAPASAASVMMGSPSNADIYSLQALPIVGNLPVVSMAWDSMKEEIKERKAEERKQKRKEEKPVEPKAPTYTPTPAAKNVMDTLTE